MQLFTSKIEKKHIYLYTAHVSHILLFALNYVYVLCLYMNVYVTAAAYEDQKRALGPPGAGVSGNKCAGNRNSGRAAVFSTMESSVQYHFFLRIV